jgi:peptidoglycan/LPS O-acetylase OafA/YrhL
MYQGEGVGPSGAGTKSAPYRPEIDGLRSIAVLAVVAFHAGFLPAGGYAGVDVFFVISGYVITRSLIARGDAGSRLDIWRFYERRVRRLLPPLLLVIAATLIAAFVITMGADARKAIVASAAACLVFGGNVYFDLVTSGYFATAAERLPLLHLWSLGVEEQFYLIWPWIFVGLMACRPRRAIGILITLILSSFACAEIVLYFSTTLAFFEMPGRFWELGIGALVAFTTLRSRRFVTKLTNISLVVIIAGLSIVWNHFPGAGALPVTLGAALLIASSAVEKAPSWATRFLASRPMVAIGRVSYPIYLWHWPLLVFARLVTVGEPSVPVRLGLVVLTFVLAFASDRLIERGIRRGRSKDARALVVATLLGCVSVACLATSLNSAMDNELRETPLQRAARLVASDSPASRLECHFRGDQAIDVHDMTACTSDTAKPVRVLLWGDSHALAMQPFAWSLAAARGVAALEMSRDACPPILGITPDKPALEVARCQRFNELAVARARGMDVVILAARWPDQIEKDDELDSLVNHTIDELSVVAGQVIVLGPTPVIARSVPDCMVRQRMDQCAVPRRDFEAVNARVVTLLRRAGGRHVNVHYVDLTSFFCGADICPATKEGTALYWDDNHVSVHAANHLASRYLQGDTRSPTW